MVVTIVCRDTINCKDTIDLCNGAQKHTQDFIFNGGVLKWDAGHDTPRQPRESCWGGGGWTPTVFPPKSFVNVPFSSSSLT